MSLRSTLVAIYVVLALLVSACGSDDITQVSSAEGDANTQPTDDGETGDDPIPVEPDGGESGDDPIPVEPDGGIGDGAEPLPGADEPEDTGTWHGAQVAETNCPGMEWKRVEASAFSFSVPADFVEADVQPIDSEVGVWAGGNGIEVMYDYGWYSGSFSGMDGTETEPVDYSGIIGEQTIKRDGPNKFVGIYFGEVKVVDGQTDLLSMAVNFTDVNDEIIGRCIVGSIQWNE